MPTYVYKTVFAKAGEEPVYHEIRQRITDEPLSAHPDTGEPIRRVILGGFGILSSAKGESSDGTGSCGPNCCCR